MKIATWNINSLRKRVDAVASWIERESPDVLCLQETKVPDADFPAGLFRECGMQVVYHGQKSYNGVAIAARAHLEEVERGLAEMPGQARLIGATVDGIRVVCVYVPNGGDRDKYAYKLEWLEHFAAFVHRQRSRFGKVVVAGDYNIAPSDEDVYDIEHWGRSSVAVRPPERQAWQRLLAAGYRDALAAAGGGGRSFTWWDYRAGAFAADRGLRIDHFLIAGLACASLQVQREVRGWPEPSDHAPVVCRLQPADD